MHFKKWSGFLAHPYSIVSYCITVFAVLADMPPDRRRIVDNNYVRYENVTKTDAQVLQCNASNKHGFVFANAYLNIVGRYIFSVLQFLFCLLATHCMCADVICLF